MSLGQALAYELKPAGVDVLTLASGPVRTEGAEAADGIDFGKLPVPSMQPAPVVRAALRALGRRPLVIPGPLNKASDFAASTSRPGARRPPCSAPSSAAPSTRSRAAADPRGGSPCTIAARLPPAAPRHRPTEPAETPQEETS